MENLPVELPIDLADFEPGSVWLVGAGPGDPGLLTIAGLHAMQSADVIVYDALVGAGILKLAAAGTELIHAGKRGGRSGDRPGVDGLLSGCSRRYWKTERAPA